MNTGSPTPRRDDHSSADPAPIDADRAGGPAPDPSQRSRDAADSTTPNTPTTPNTSNTPNTPTTNTAPATYAEPFTPPHVLTSGALDAPVGVTSPGISNTHGGPAADPDSASHETPALGLPAVVLDDRFCNACSYSLRGLPIDGVCPECGRAVIDSIRGVMLEYASKEYIRSVRSGLAFVLNGILASIIVFVASMILIAVATPIGLGRTNAEMITSAASLAVSIVLLVGYWRFTRPDPGFIGVEKPNSSRAVIRAAVIIQAIGTLGSLVTAVVADLVNSVALRDAIDVVDWIILALNYIAWIVQFFAVMRYTRWLGRRVPDAVIVRRATRYAWMLPLIAIIGAIAFYIGPLISLILYWNLLDRLRRHVRSIERVGRPAVMWRPGIDHASLRPS